MAAPASIPRSRLGTRERFMTYRSLACSLAFLLTLTGIYSRAESAEIKVLSSAAVKEAYVELASGSRTDFVKSGIGIAVRAGMPKPDVSSGEAVKNAVLAAKSVAYSSGPSGNYIAGLFQKMAIGEQIKGRVTQTPSGVQVGEVVARGDAELGFQQVSELL